MSSTPTLIIGNKNYSSWSLRPWLLLRHFGVAFDEILLPLDTPEYYRRIGDYSPTGRVPVLRCDDVDVWDSLAICETANERWLDGRGWPADPAARALARSAAAEMHSGFPALRQQLPFNCRRRPDHYRWSVDADRDIVRIQQLWRSLRSRQQTAGEFLCGDFGIVDAMFAPVCVRFRGYGVAVDEFAADYMRTIFALPAFVEWDAAGSRGRTLCRHRRLRRQSGLTRGYLPIEQT
jgi:glutathione S-transferase